MELRIQGQLKKLGHKISPATFKHILKENGLSTAPKRNGNWSEFLKRHAETLWTSDFISKRIITKIGFRVNSLAFKAFSKLRFRPRFNANILELLNLRRNDF